LHPAVITIARCSSLVEAQLVRARLGAHGIAAHLPEERSAAVLCESFDGTSGVRVLVAGGDAARACEVLGLGGASKPADARPGAPARHCEVCRAPRPEPAARVRLPRWIRLRARRRACAVCGHLGSSE
jgi:hypothetical protein